MITLLSPIGGQTVPVFTEHQRAYRDREDSTENIAVIDWLNLKREDKDDCTFPLPTVFSWAGGKAPYTLEVSLTADFARARTVVTEKSALALENLRVDTLYYWRVNGSAPETFRTEAGAPRWLRIGGITNVRDAGGWQTCYGKAIRQGLLFRGSELDRHHTITDEGIRFMREELGIRTDLDLRRECELTQSPLGGDVRFPVIPIDAYQHFIKETHSALTKQVFDVLSEPDNYPIYYHCWGGADRTGTVAYLLGAVLGMAERDLIEDYELTTLSVWKQRSRHSDHFTAFMEALEPYGSDYRSRCENYLRACGVDDAQQAQLRRILLEP